VEVGGPRGRRSGAVRAGGRGGRCGRRGLSCVFGVLSLGDAIHSAMAVYCHRTVCSRVVSCGGPTLASRIRLFSFVGYVRPAFQAGSFGIHRVRVADWGIYFFFTSGSSLRHGRVVFGRVAPGLTRAADLFYCPFFQFLPSWRFASDDAHVYAGCALILSSHDTFLDGTLCVGKVLTVSDMVRTVCRF